MQGALCRRPHHAFGRAGNGESPTQTQAGLPERVSQALPRHGVQGLRSAVDCREDNEVDRDRRAGRRSRSGLGREHDVRITLPTHDEDDVVLGVNEDRADGALGPIAQHERADEREVLGGEQGDG